MLMLGDAATRGQIWACDPLWVQLDPVMEIEVQMLLLGCPVNDFTSSVTKPGGQIPTRPRGKSHFACQLLPCLSVKQ